MDEPKVAPRTGTHDVTLALDQLEVYKYADYVFSSSNQSGFRLILGTVSVTNGLSQGTPQGLGLTSVSYGAKAHSPHVVAHTLVAMSPETIVELRDVLDRQIAAYEEKHGPIRRKIVEQANVREVVQ